MNANAQSRPVPGILGWVLLAIFVFLWDTNRRTETLSNAFAPPTTHGRKGAVILWTYTTAHLLRLLPHKADLFRLIGDLGE